MSTARTKQIEGFAAIGSEIPFVDPCRLVIVGLDEPETTDNWFAHCSRLKDVSDADLAEYLDCVRQRGSIDNVVKGVRDGNRVLVLDGRSTTRVGRLLRAEQAQKRVPIDKRVTVRVRIYQGEPEQLFRINVDSHKARQLTRMQEAKSVLTCWKNLGEDRQRTATTFGKDPKWVDYHLSLFDLHPDLQKKVDAGEAPVRVLAQIARLPREEQKKKYAELEAAGATRGAAAKNGVERALAGKPVGPADKTRMVTGTFLKKWREEIEKQSSDRGLPLVSVTTLLDIILRREVPPDVDSVLRDTLEAAGWKFNRDRPGDRS